MFFQRCTNFSVLIVSLVWKLVISCYCVKKMCCRLKRVAARCHLHSLLSSRFISAHRMSAAPPTGAPGWRRIIRPNKSKSFVETLQPLCCLFFYKLNLLLQLLFVLGNKQTGTQQIQPGLSCLWCLKLFLKLQWGPRLCGTVWRCWEGGEVVVCCCTSDVNRLCLSLKPKASVLKTLLLSC